MAIKFAETLCTHTKGQWAGGPWKFIPWQRMIFENVYGTFRENGLRQYRTVYIEVPKKSGKSEMASTAALIGLVADDEAGAEVYSAAGDREQASLVYYPAAQMVRNSKVLSRRLKIVDSRKRIVDYQTNSFYQVLSSESFTKHGINPSTIVFDELHAQPNRELFDVLTEGTDIARQQQLIWIITTAGVADKTSIGWEIHEYAKNVLDGLITDQTFYPVLFCADPDKDDWTDPEVWKKVNPSLIDDEGNGIFDLANIEQHYQDVCNNPARINNFQRFRLNMWVGQVIRYIPMDKWDACGEMFDIDALKGRICYGGLDLSSSTDLSSFVLVFPPDSTGEKWKVVPKFYIPGDNMAERIRRDNVSYDSWARQGLVTVTPGSIIDYSFIRRDINEASKAYNLRELSYDPWGAIQLAVMLQEEDGIPCVEHRQGFKSMSPPTKELLNFVLSGKLTHRDNPVLRWNANNLSVKIDAAENVKPEKDKSAGRIDGVVALIMALGRSILAFNKTSVYQERGILVL